MKVSAGTGLGSVSKSALNSSPIEANQGRGTPIYLSDLSRCEPNSALSKKVAKDRWHLLPYETDESKLKSGTMMGAASFINAPEVRLTPNISGWHAIYVGYWNPHHAYDGGMTIKVKLSDDPCFTRIKEAEPVYGQGIHATTLQEAFFKIADLSGREIVFGKLRGPFPEKAYIAYAKLVPLSKKEVDSIQKDRARTDTRVVQAVIDGISYFWRDEYSTREHILEKIERYRYSDVGKVTWAVCYGDLTNYPSKVGHFWASEREVPIEVIPGRNIYIAGEKVAYESLKSLTSAGIIIPKVAAKHVHEMGLKFDAMFRLSIAGHIPPHRGTKEGNFVENHPEFRQVMRDGTPIEKASYAFPEVRDLMLSIIQETAETFDIDGANLCFTRGPQFAAYEKPVLEDFRKEYGTDGRKVGYNDPRMRSIRSRYSTRLVRGARRVLDQVGAKKGKRLELSAWVPRTIERQQAGGMEVLSWIREGLLDSVISHGMPAEPEIIAAAKAKHCRYYYAPSPSWHNDKAWAKQVKDVWAAYQAGLNYAAFWDIDLEPQDRPAWWAMGGRVGHRQELEAFAKEMPTQGPAGPKLKTIGGVDVLQGLREAAYSGG